MGIRILDIDEVHSISIEGLGLDTESLDLTSTEAIAAILRRGGGFHCPCSPRRLVRYATEALSGLNDEPEKIESAVKEILEDLETFLLVDELRVFLSVGVEVHAGAQVVHLYEVCLP